MVMVVVVVVEPHLTLVEGVGVEVEEEHCQIVLWKGELEEEEPCQVVLGEGKEEVPQFQSNQWKGVQMHA